MTKLKDDENTETKLLPKFTKEQIINSKRLSIYKKDVLVAILKNDCLYTIEEVDNLVKSFLERKVDC